MRSFLHRIFVYLIPGIVFLSGSIYLYAGTTPYVLLISFDGFRWDYLDRGLTPHLDSLSARGVRALSLRSTFPSKTFPNHLSIITGMYPEHHGIIHNRFLDPFTGEKYQVGDTNSVRDARWYLGEALWETAERQGIRTACYFWPGSELRLSYRHPTYYEKYDHQRSYRTRVDGVIRWLQLPQNQRPHFITLYFDATDTQGHAHGPDAPETDAAIRRLDEISGYLFHRLRHIGMLDSINIIIVSDHGMTTIRGDQLINIEKRLDGYDCLYQGIGPVMMITPPSEQEEAVLQVLRQHAQHYRAYLRNEIPEFYHFRHHPFISPIVVIAEPGWSLVTNAMEPKMRKRKVGGNHGYDPNYLDMQGIFLAAGPAFKSGYRTGTLWNIDIYPLICHILGIMPRQNIDGKLERIAFILRE